MRAEIEKALVLISQKFRQKLTTDMLAKEAGLSPFHFHRLFIEESGFTPQKYLEKLRLEHAAHVMVLDPGLKMIQLAFESGFSSPSSFSRSFQQYFGMSPSRYKKEKVPAYKGNPEAVGESFRLTKGLEISYLAHQHFNTHLIHPLAKEIEAKISEMQLYGQEHIYGIYLDAPIHHDPAHCRYLIGFPTDKNQKHNADLAGGYFLHFQVSGKMEVLREQLMRIHKYLIHLNYAIKTPIALERFRLPEDRAQFTYLDTPRELFIPVIRK